MEPLFKSTRRLVLWLHPASYVDTDRSAGEVAADLLTAFGDHSPAADVVAAEWMDKLDAE